MDNKIMKILFIHQNFPAQFIHIANKLAKNKKHELVALKPDPVVQLPGVRVINYSYLKKPQPNIHPLLSDFEAKILRAEACANQCLNLKNDKGFYPDIIVAHPGWGETLFLKDVWKDAKTLFYFEYYYSPEGQDFDFDPEFKIDSFELIERLRLKNTVNLHALEIADKGYSPTEWQKNTHPQWSRKKIRVIHEGIDTEFFKPDKDQFIEVKNKGVKLTRDNEIITFAARYLEPVRGFHIFMRALPELLKERPNAHVLIMGHEKHGYGAPPKVYPTYKTMMLDELRDKLDPNRVHFTNWAPKDVYRNILQVSSAHVHLTYPFLLSWSMLEAMSVGAPVIASDTAPVREMIRHEENGLLFDFFDTNGLVNQIVRVLEDKDLREKIIENGKNEVVKRFNLKDSLKTLEKLIIS